MPAAVTLPGRADRPRLDRRTPSHDPFFSPSIQKRFWSTRGGEEQMRRRIAPVATLVAAVPRVVRRASWPAATTGAAAAARKSGDQAKLGGTVKLWIMPNGPKPKEDMDAPLKPFEEKTGVKVDTEVVGWDVQFDRIRNAADLGRGPGRHAGGHDAGAVLRRARRLRGHQQARRGRRRQGRLPEGRVADDAGRRP